MEGADPPHPSPQDGSTPDVTLDHPSASGTSMYPSNVNHSVFVDDMAWEDVDRLGLLNSMFPEALEDIKREHVEDNFRWEVRHLFDFFRKLYAQEHDQIR